MARRRGASPVPRAGSGVGLVHPAHRGGRAEDRGGGPGPAHHHRRRQRRARRDRAPPAREPRRGGRSLPVDAGLDRERAHVAVPQHRLRAAAPRGGEGRGRLAPGGRPGRARDPDRGGRRQCPPAPAAAAGPVRHGPLRRPLRGDARAAARARGRGPAPRGGGALAHPAARRRAARAHLLALHADLRHGPPVQGRAPVHGLLGRGPRAAARPRPRARRRRSVARATGASRSCASSSSRRRRGR